MTQITKRYFGQGLVQGTTKLFYTFDHLGSVRELVDDAGVVQAQYRYSTYGERTKETGNLDSDFGWAGLWHHGPSGLDLATYRIYDSANKRWISRDPLGEGVDYNLYRYCGNNPMNFIDPDGNDALALGALVAAVGEAGAAISSALSTLGTAAAAAAASPAAIPVAATLAVGGVAVATGAQDPELVAQGYEIDWIYSMLDDPNPEIQVYESPGAQINKSPADQAVQMAKDKSRGRGGNKGKTTKECKLKGAEHTKNASPSKRPKHQKGRARAGRDQLRKEKGDKSRPY